jgi:PAS domain S-box-containing protein
VIQFGYTAQELLSGAVPFSALVHPEDLEWVGREVREYSESGAERFQQEYRIVAKDGAVRWVDDRTVVERGADGQILFYQGTVVDITERKSAEAELRERENLLGSIFRASPTGIGVVSDRVLLAVNDRICQMIGRSRDELIGRSARVLYPGDADFEYVGAEKYRQIRERGTGSVETRWQCKDGRIIDVLMSSTPIDPGNLAAGVTFTALDITERKRAEETLRSSLEEKESLLKEVHHRVKNTLQVISSLLNLQVRQAGSAAVRAFLQDTQNRVRSMAVLHEILYRSGNLARISFPQYVKSICAHLARSYAADAGNIRLRREIADISLSMDQAVPAGLIINELVSNAFKHAFPDRAGGEILVQVRSDDDQRLVLRVADDGVGMPADPKNQGVEALGLRLVDNLVRQLDGQLTIRSDPGAAFQIVFPVRPAERSDA